MRMIPLVDGIYLHKSAITVQSYLFPEPYWIHVQLLVSSIARAILDSVLLEPYWIQVALHDPL